MSTTIKDDLRKYRRELAKIEPRYLALKELVVNMERLLSLDTAKDNIVDLDDVVVPEDTFDEVTTKDAALFGLYYINDTVKAGVLADFLEEHGFQHHSKNLANTVNTALDRLSKDALVEKVTGRGWRITPKGEADSKARLEFPLADFLR